MGLSYLSRLFLPFRIQSPKMPILLYKVVSVFCLSQPILFSFTVKLPIGHQRDLNYFWGGCLYQPPPKKYFLLFKNYNLKWVEVDLSPSYLKCPQRLLGVQPLVFYKAEGFFCPQRKISVFAKPIWFSFAVKLPIGPGKCSLRLL